MEHRLKEGRGSDIEGCCESVGDSRGNFCVPFKPISARSCEWRSVAHKISARAWRVLAKAECRDVDKDEIFLRGASDFSCQDAG